MGTERIRIAPGIQLQGETLIADVRIGSARNGSQRRVTKRFTRGMPEFDEFDRLGTVTKLEAWQYQQKHDLILAAPVAPERGTFEGDVPTWLHSLPAGLYHDESVAIMAHWIGAMMPQEKPQSPIRLGTLSRHELTRLQVQAQLARWKDAGAAVGTCNKRLSRLRKFYQALDGLMAPNPTDKITFEREPEAEPRDIPVHLVKLILDSLPDLGRAEQAGDKRPALSQTKTRLQVMAWTGMAPATLRRVKTRDLDLAHGRIYLTPRRKGKGSKGAWVALLPEAVVALRAFVAAGLVGKTWARSSVRKTWHRGIERATKSAFLHAERTGDRSWVDALANLPPNCKPYDLRHSFAAELYRRTSDIRAVAELLQHADMETTKRYTKGAVSERVAAAIATASPAFANIPTIPPAPTTKAAKARAAMRLVRKAV